MSAEILAEAFSVPHIGLSFQRRPSSVPADLRLGWRISALTLILDQCRGKTANLEQVHLLTWALRSAETRELIARWFDGSQRPDDLVVRFDPSMTRTITLCVAGGIVRWNANHTITLLEPGIELVSDVRGAADVMGPEKAFLSMLPRPITQKSIQALLEWK